MNNHYAVLEVSMQASPQEIKAAYRRLARRYHPDANPDHPKASELFQQIRRAYEVLSSSSSRHLYDRELLRQHGNASVFDTQVSPYRLLKQSEDLLKYTRTLDKRVLNSDALTDYVLSLLHPDHIDILIRHNDLEINQKISINVMNSCNALVSSRLYAQIVALLLRLHPDKSSDLHQRLLNELAHRQKIEHQNKIVPLAAVGLIILFILLMMLVLRS